MSPRELSALKGANNEPTMSPQGLIVGHCWLIVPIMSPYGLIINNELFTMRSHLIMRLIVPQVYPTSFGVLCDPYMIHV